MDFDHLRYLHRSHPAWTLLRAEHAPMVIGFLHRTFIIPQCTQPSRAGPGRPARRLAISPAPASRRRLLTPSRLTEDEFALFTALRGDAWGERVRLEQERVGFACLERALTTLMQQTQHTA